MSVRQAALTERQYTDIMLVIGADHMAGVSGVDAALLLALPVLWMIGVVAFVALKLFRSR